MNLPGAMLTHEITARAPATTGPRGGTLESTPRSIRAHVEDRRRLRVDARADSDTYGQQIMMRTRIITRIDDELTIGTVIEWNGQRRTVADVSRLEHRLAPSHFESWAV